ISNGMLVRLIRNVYWYIGPFVTLGYAVLIGCSVSLVYYRAKEAGTIWFKRRVCPVMGKAFLLSVVVLLFGVYAYPFWTGTIIYPGGEVIPSNHYEVPSYYAEANDWLNTLNDDFRLFSLPFATGGNLEVMDWEHGYYGSAVTPWLLDRPVISSAKADSSANLATQVATMLTDSESQGNEVGKILALLDVRYVVLHRDANWQYIEGHSWWISTSLEQYQINLGNQQGLELEKSFGELDFYRNDYWQPAGLYATTDATFAQGGSQSMALLLSTPEVVTKAAIFLSGLGTEQDDFALEKATSVYLVDQACAYTTGDDGSITASYTFNTPKDGTYTIYADDLNEVETGLSFRVDGGPLQICTGPISDSSTRQLGTVWLSQGSHVVAVVREASNVLEGDFEGSTFGSWQVATGAGSAHITDADSYQGLCSAELSPSSGSSAIVYADLGYDGQASININARLKVVSRTYPAGAFIYVRGYDADNVERVRMIYYTYDSWDYATSDPETNGQTFYVLKTDLGDPTYNTWMAVDQNPRDEFEASFPGVWEALHLTQIAVELSSSGDGAITSRYDAVRVTGGWPSPLRSVSLYSTSTSDQTVQVTFEKINPTKYLVHVQATQPFFLVFSDSYNSGWKAYVDQAGDETNWIEALFRDPVSEDNHLQVNGYANAWYIDPSKLGVGDEFDITLYFRDQSLFYVGCVISGVVFVGLTALLLLSWKKVKWKSLCRRGFRKVQAFVAGAGEVAKQIAVAAYSLLGIGATLLLIDQFGVVPKGWAGKWRILHTREMDKFISVFRRGRQRASGSNEVPNTAEGSESAGPPPRQPEGS
ncbi:MAG: hypothetical protein NTU41_04215, partial [Chloroflexi bacterium]|nr:hypothetical protein [Chloroflexota bacterium]